MTYSILCIKPETQRVAVVQGEPFHTLFFTYKYRISPQHILKKINVDEIYLSDRIEWQIPVTPIWRTYIYTQKGKSHLPPPSGKEGFNGRTRALRYVFALACKRAQRRAQIEQPVFINRVLARPPPHSPRLSFPPFGHRSFLAINFPLRVTRFVCLPTSDGVPRVCTHAETSARGRTARTRRDSPGVIEFAVIGVWKVSYSLAARAALS